MRGPALAEQTTRASTRRLRLVLVRIVWIASFADGRIEWIACAE
jgi:hypothetical protein